MPTASRDNEAATATTDPAATDDERHKDRDRTLYLIDGHSQFFRAYYAIRSRMTSPVTKEPTHLTYGFMGMLLKLLREDNPDYIAVVIDASGDRETFRSEIYPEYKANREAPPEDFRPQVQRCLQLLDQLGIPVIAEVAVEADDVIATLVDKLKLEHPDLRIRIVSRDKDLTQLINDRVEMFDAMKDQAVTPAELFKVDEVDASHVVDILALMGDTSDNIPGVPGIGPKTAAQLILKYKTVENLLDHLDEIKGKRRENLEASREAIALSKQLVQLKRDLDIDFNLDDARYQPQRIETGPLLATLRELNFNRHIDDVKALVGGDAAQDDGARTDDGSLAGGLFDQAPEKADVTRTTAVADCEYRAIVTEEDLAALVQRLRSAGTFAFDTETDSISPISANLCGISVAIEPNRAWYIPVRSPQSSEHLDLETVLKHFKPLLEDESLSKIVHNAKFDTNVLRTHGVTLRGRIFDTMIASYCIDASRSSHAMNVLALALLDHTCIPISDLIGKGKQQKCFDDVPLEQATIYAAEDADITLRLWNIFEEQLESSGLRKLFDELEMPLVEVLAELEYNGIRLDPDELDRQKALLTEQIDELRIQISQNAPHEFNPDSPKQLAAALFNKPEHEPPGLGLKIVKRGKTGPSTDVEVLEKLAADPDIHSPVPAMIIEYRQFTKLVGTYLDALKEAINPVTGRVHASFNQTVAATGRLSSSDPNLQNIPIRTEVGREIRRAFVAEPDHVLLTADYSQIELRLLAHLSEDPALIDAFNRGEDIHTAVAAEVYDIDPADVTAEQRNSAKMVNFGIIYGITPYGLARRLGAGTSNEQAAEIIDSYKARFNRIDTFLQQCIADAEQHGYVETMLGRRRMIPQIHSKNFQMRSLGERMAINSVVQGSAADLIKLAMINLHRELTPQYPEVRMVLQIHDELVFEVPQEQIDGVQEFVVDRMQQAMDLRVPLVVESAWSGNWIDAK